MRVMVALRVEVPPERRSELPALLAAEGELVAEHMRLGVMEASYVSADRTTIWAVLTGDSLEEVQRLTASYPMYAYFKDLTFTPLS